MSVFDYLDVQTDVDPANNIIAIHITTKPGFKDAVSSLATSIIGACDMLASSEEQNVDEQNTTAQSTENDQTTTQSSEGDQTASEQATQPPVPPEPPKKYGWGNMIKFRAVFSSSLYGETDKDFPQDNKTYTITIHGIPVTDTFELEIYGNKIPCMSPV